MTMSSVVAINVILDAAIVIAILAVLGWGMRAQFRDMRAPWAQRRRVGERRRHARPMPPHAERRESQRGREALA